MRLLGGRWRQQRPYPLAELVQRCCHSVMLSALLSPAQRHYISLSEAEGLLSEGESRKCRSGWRRD